MLAIEAIDHVGIRVSDKATSIGFYECLGFEAQSDHGFEQGHPVVMRHRDSGVTLNLLGPATVGDGANVLMDRDEKHPGYTHMALRVTSLEATRAFLEAHGIAITGQFRFGRHSAVFIRDPDRNVIELDEYSADSADGKGTHP